MQWVKQKTVPNPGVAPHTMRMKQAFTLEHALGGTNGIIADLVRMRESLTGEDWWVLHIGDLYYDLQASTEEGAKTEAMESLKRYVADENEACAEQIEKLTKHLVTGKEILAKLTEYPAPEQQQQHQ